MSASNHGAASSQNSSAQYDLSSSFDAALAQVDVDAVVAGNAELQPGTGRRKVAFADDVVHHQLEDIDYDHYHEDDPLDDDKLRSLFAAEGAALPTPGDANEGLPRLQDDYLEHDAYSAIKFGDISNYMRHRRVKLQNQNKAIAEMRAEGKEQIFKGLEIYINGHVQPSLQVLRELIMEHGGTYIPYLDRKGMITHIIASNLTPAKFREFRTYKVATPAWLTESVAAGRLLDWRQYKLVAGGGVEEGLRGGMSGWMGSQVKDAKVIGHRASPSGVKSSAEGQKADGPALESSSASLDRDKIAVEPTVDPSAWASGEKRNRTRSASPPYAPAAEMRLDTLPSIEKPGVLTGHPRVAIPATPQNSVNNRRVISDEKAAEAVAPDQVMDQVTPMPSRALAPVFSPLASKQAHDKSPANDKSVGTDPSKFEDLPYGGYAKYQEHPDAKRLVSDEKWRKEHTAANEGFIDGYYQNSRLHYLSTWKAELKVLVAAAQNQADSVEVVQTMAPGAALADSLSLANSALPQLQTRKSDATTAGDKIILHVDFDAFFVSCGIASRPELKGKPVVVCHSRQGGIASTSEIASCSYEARAMGVRNGESLGQARRKCPEIQTIPYEFETYKSNSLKFYTILMAYSDELQAVSIDEALLDATSRVAALANASPSFRNDDEILDEDGPRDWVKVLMEKIRNDVRCATNCEVSIGAANNILLAKLATRKAKPAGCFHLQTPEVATFLSTLDVSDLPDFAWATCKKIEEEWGSTSCKDLLDKPKSVMKATLGDKTGEKLFGYLRGIDHRKIESSKERKSVSAEVNYGIRFLTTEEAEEFVMNLAKEVAKRLTQLRRLGRSLTMKVMERHPDASRETPKFMGHGVCIVHNKSLPISSGFKATDDPEIIGNTAVKILRSYNIDPTELRGIGIQIQKLEGGVEVNLEAGQGQIDFTKAVTKTAASAPAQSVPESKAVSTKPKQEKPVARQQVPMSKFGKRQAVHSVATRSAPLVEIPDPSTIDPEIWTTFMDESERQQYRSAWRQRSIVIPAALEPPPAKSITRGAVKRAASRSASVEPAAKRSKFLISDAADRSPARTTSVDRQAEPVAKQPTRALGPTSSELGTLGINEEGLQVFRALSPESQMETMQHFQQMQKLTRKGPDVKLPGKLGKTKVEERAIAVDPAPRPAFSNTKITDIDSVIETILQWTEHDISNKPAKTSVKAVQKYLLRLLDPKMSGVGGVQDAVLLLFSWKRCIQSSFAAAQGTEDSILQAWRSAFRQVRLAVDEAAIERFGYGLSLPA